jgi:hypothetical protein
MKKRFTANPEDRTLAEDMEMKRKGGAKYKTGGMVNANAKAAASKVTKGRVGGTSKAPKKAVPGKK